MAIYTVHEPPSRIGAAAPDPERYVFVRDGFSFWAFVFGPLWMLRHRMWLVLLLYIVVSLALDAAIRFAGASAFIVGCVGFLLSLLIGLEASSLRRFTLQRRGWKYAGVVAGEDREAAERRFFDTWLRSEKQPVALAIAPALNPNLPRTSDIIGLFPQPGLGR
jgi:Protein of unknown function (DUF2628)